MFHQNVNGGQIAGGGDRDRGSMMAEHWTEVAAAQHEGGRTYELHTLIGFFCTKFEIKRNYKLMKLMIHNLITNYVIKLGINSIKLYVSFQYIFMFGRASAQAQPQSVCA